MDEHPSHAENLVALRRIEGQIRGLQKMIEEKKYCVDILTQICSVKGAITRVEDNILEKHLSSCVETAVKGKSSEEKNKKLKEAFMLMRQFRKGYR